MAPPYRKPSPGPLVPLCTLCDATGVFTVSSRESLRSTCPRCKGTGYDLPAMLAGLDRTSS